MVGKVIDGFQLVKFLGKGNFGSVYQCIKEEKLYAIKIFASDFVYSEFLYGDDNRITREINALKMVNSEYVVKYVADGSFVENEWEYFYVVMDYVDGQSLKDVLIKNSFSIEEAVKIFQSILKGIHAIHKANLIHRDLKPANIYLTKDKKIKILDFGLSKLIDFSSITHTGDQLGSPLYMSPEQISDSKNIDYRSDYYALGVLFFELLSKKNPYGQFSSREELYYKIKVEPAMSIRTLIPTINNSIDNLIACLLQKENYKRPNSIATITSYLEVPNDFPVGKKGSDFLPSFFVRLWNERKVLEDFYNDGFSVEHAIFPINHQNKQKNLLLFLQKENIDFIIDPATMRLAYDSYSEVKGMVSLPYAPNDLSRLELDDLNTLIQKQNYVKQVVHEQLKYNPAYIVSPFHFSGNANLISIKSDPHENWFSLDAKLSKETKDYLDSLNYQGKLLSGFCIKTDILTTRTEKEYFLNILTSLNCDAYWIYVDCIDNNSNFSQLYNYANTLLELQKETGKPVIAGRIGPFGLVLLAFGIFGFESGTSRFETFYEDLYKERGESFNMYSRYYFPELLSNVAIERKNPAKIIQLLTSNTGEHIGCKCPYCINQNPAGLINDGLSRKHFLYRRNQEIDEIRKLNSTEERVDYIEGRIKQAIRYYKDLKPIFKDDDSRFLKVWLDVIEKLRKEWL